VLKYPSVKWQHAFVDQAKANQDGFLISTTTGDVFSTKKLLLATGVKDQLLQIPGFAECWGISVLHCPYCHGFEVKNQVLGVMGNGEQGFEFARLIHHWSKNLTLFTNGPSSLQEDQTQYLNAKQIGIVETPIKELIHKAGQLEGIQLADGNIKSMQALFARVPFVLSGQLANQLGCTLNAQGLIQVDEFKKTNVPGVFAAGDNSSIFRALSAVIAAGTQAGAFINHELIVADFSAKNSYKK
jgi:thioredoxin reductase